jgi:hypothetical protein
MRIYARGWEDMSGREKTTQQKDALRAFQQEDTETREKQRALDHNFRELALLNPVYGRRVNSFVLVCSLSSHRHFFIPLIFGSRFIDS